MVYYNKNKNELLALTGAVYSFVAYLTAFTLEVLFIIDLAKRNSGLISATAINSSQNNYDENPSQTVSTFDQAKLALESMQTHVTISCLAISILYFIIFVTSLVLIVALILRSSFFILIWLCIMITLYLPEFGLILYVSIYGWGIDTRNGQTELLFYLIRAILNVIFIFKAYKLLKEWNQEKNFFMLKSGNRFTSYDSPYFIGDSLTTTINPVFSSSTLNLNRYDKIRDFNKLTTSKSISPDYDFMNHYDQGRDTDTNRRASMYIREEPGGSNGGRYRNSYSEAENVSGRKGFYLMADGKHDVRDKKAIKIDRMQMRQNSVPSIDDNDDFADCEMDLDYRTLTNQRYYTRNNEPTTQQASRVYTDVDYGLSRMRSSNQSPGDLSYSTQSLDRRHLRDLDFALSEHVILRPLGHQPFDYLKRPGSYSNLTSTNNLNTQPTLYSSNTKLTTKRSDLNLHDHNNLYT